MCCHRVHGGRIRRARTVPGRAASGEDLGVQRGFDLQTSRRRRSSTRALSEELGSQAAVDAPHHAIHAQVKTFGVFNEKKGSGKKKGLALPAAPSIPNPLAAPPAPAPAPAPAPTKGKGCLLYTSPSPRD